MSNIDVIMPQMGESITEGTLVKWLKKEGDAVQRDEPLFEISTEKVDVEIPSPAAGVLISIRVKEGDTVPVNTVVAEIGQERADANPARPPAALPLAAPTTGGELSLADAKAAPEPAAPEPAAPGPAAPGPVAARASGERVRSSPLVKKIAREHDIDLTQVAGTGLGGRITKDDILGFIEAGEAKPLAAAAAPRVAAPAPPVAPTSGPAPALTGRVEPLSRMRKSIAEHMVLSRRTSAHVQTVFEVDMETVVKLRARHAATFEEKHATKLTYTGIIARSVVRSLQEFPVLNASIDGDNVVYHAHVHLGIAVALDQGLIVPVVKSAEEKNLLGIQRAINDLAGRARDRKLLPGDVAGGTFTITNPGIFGGLFGLPIINQPQVAILGVGGFEKRPVVRNDAIAIATMAYLSLSFDHRLVDGAVADQFMAFLKDQLQTTDDIG